MSALIIGSKASLGRKSAARSDASITARPARRRHPTKPPDKTPADAAPEAGEWPVRRVVHQPRSPRPRHAEFVVFGCGKQRMARLFRGHCERSEAILGTSTAKTVDCFAPLAMTIRGAVRSLAQRHLRQGDDAHAGCFEALPGGACDNDAG